MHVFAKFTIFAIVINILLLLYFFKPIELFDIKPDFIDFDVGNLVKSGTAQHFEKKKLAVIVPYRNSFKELVKFVPHMNRFLKNQKIPFHIFIIHQTDQLRFNRGALLNIGYNYTREKFDYTAHHDVDLLPLNPKLSYEFPKDGVFHPADIFYHPTVIDIEPYIGGILVVPNEIYELTNGLRHDFWGWGGEDEEYFYVLVKSNVTIHKPPHDFETTRINTFLHLHDENVRPRDKQRCKGQDVNVSVPRSQNCDLHGTKFKLEEVQELVVDGAKFSMINVELLCDPMITPWCTC